MLKMLILCFFITFSFASQDQLLQEIKNLIEQNGKKIEQNGKQIEQNGKKIEQNGKKIEQNSTDIKIMQSQVSYTQTLLSNLIGGVITILFFTIYLQRKGDKYLEQETRQNSISVNKLLMALKELSEDDPKIQRSLRVAGIL